MAIYKKTIRKGMGVAGLFFLLAAFASYMDGNSSAALWSMVSGFILIVIALTYKERSPTTETTEK
jgi:hypothetical protein